MDRTKYAYPVNIDERFHETGFAEVANTRMLYAPLEVKEHRDMIDGDPIVTSEANWGPVTPAQHRAVVEALRAAYPHRTVR